MSGMNCDKLESQVGEVEEVQSAVAFDGPGVAALCGGFEDILACLPTHVLSRSYGSATRRTFI